MGKFVILVPYGLVPDEPVFRALWRDAVEDAGFTPAGDPSWEMVCEIPEVAVLFDREPITAVRIEGTAS